MCAARSHQERDDAVAGLDPALGTAAPLGEEESQAIETLIVIDLDHPEIIENPDGDLDLDPGNAGDPFLENGMIRVQDVRLIAQ